MKTTSWQEYVNFPNLSPNREPVVQRGNMSISTQINIKKFRNNHHRARTVHTNRASAGYKPLGKVVNVPKLVKDYKSLKPKKVKHPFFDFIDAQEGKKQEKAQIPEFEPEDDLRALNKVAVDRLTKVMREQDKFNHRDRDLELELKKSRQRMTQVKNGNGVLAVFSAPLTRRGTPANKKVRPLSIDTSEAIDTCPDFLNSSLKEKLDFYDDSPRSLTRHIQTSHNPWRNRPNIKRAPDSEIFIKDNQAASSTTDIDDTVDRKQEPEDQPRKLYYHPDHLQYLGADGTEMLMRIIDDEKHELAPTAKELEIFAALIRRNMRKRLITVRARSRKDDLLKRVQLGTAIPSKLIKSYFK